MDFDRLAEVDFDEPRTLRSRKILLTSPFVCFFTDERVRLEMALRSDPLRRVETLCLSDDLLLE